MNCGTRVVSGPCGPFAGNMGFALSLGIYWAWMSIACFSTMLFSAAPNPERLTESFNLASLAACTGVTAVVACLPENMARSIERSVASIPCCALLGLLGTALAGYAWWDGVLFLAGSIAAGMAEGFLLYLLFAATMRKTDSVNDVIFTVCMALIISTIIYFACMAAGEASAVICALLPALAALPACMFVRDGNCHNAKPSRRARRADEAVGVPWKFLVGLSIFGLMFGLMHISVADSTPELTRNINVAHMLSRGLIAAVAVALVVWRKHAYWVLSTVQLAGFVSGLFAFMMPGPEGPVLMRFAITAGFTCLELFQWSILFELRQETHRPFNFLFGVMRFLVMFASLIANAAVVLVADSISPIALHAALLVLLVTMVVVSSSLFGSRNIASLWGLSRDALSDDARTGADISAMLIGEYGLTQREAEIAILLTKGRNEPFISEMLFISPSTTHSHVMHIYKKTGVHSRQELLDLVERES